MVFVNGEKIEEQHFSDGTLIFNYDAANAIKRKCNVKVSWFYEKDDELLTVVYITRHLQEHGIEDIYLYLPYVPNARQDRVKSSKDIFTLKYFAEIINSLNFKSVVMFDPHSDVCPALFNRTVVQSAENFINLVIDKVSMNKSDLENIIMFYPDEGATKRYADMNKIPYIYGVKHRDWESHEIRGLEIQTNGLNVQGKTVIMVDDICSSGKTLLYAAQKLKAIGVGKIFLYVSHCEDQIKNSPLLNTDIVDTIFTTNSVLTERHPKIHVIQLAR